MADIYLIQNCFETFSVNERIGHRNEGLCNQGSSHSILTVVFANLNKTASQKSIAPVEC